MSWLCACEQAPAQALPSSHVALQHKTSTEEKHRSALLHWKTAHRTIGFLARRVGFLRFFSPSEELAQVELWLRFTQHADDSLYLCRGEGTSFLAQKGAQAGVEGHPRLQPAVGRPGLHIRAVQLRQLRTAITLYFKHHFGVRGCWNRLAVSG